MHYPHPRLIPLRNVHIYKHISIRNPLPKTYNLQEKEEFYIKHKFEQNTRKCLDLKEKGREKCLAMQQLFSVLLLPIVNIEGSKHQTWSLVFFFEILQEEN